MSAQNLSDLQVLARLGVAMGCGALIGIERQYRSRMAGLRTNTLVATGAALFVLYSQIVGDPGSPTRVASYVVSGVGFLGGGVILREGFNVRGLNTAATLWCSAAVSLVATTGRYPLALGSAAAVVVVHLIGRPAGRAIDRAPAAAEDTVGAYTLRIVARRKHETQLRALLLSTLSDPTILLQGLSTHRQDTDPDDAGSATASVHLVADLLIEGNAAELLDRIVTRLSAEPGLRTVSWTSRQDSDDRNANISE